MSPKHIAFVSLALAAGGCGATIPGILTGSTQTAPVAVAQNDSLTRALQVGGTAARAQKCGFNFDAAKLKTQFIATESAANPADGAKATQIYDTAYRGVSRALSSKGGEYCTTSKTNMVKAALNRHLAGDYTPDPPAPAGDSDDGTVGILGTTVEVNH